MEGVLINPARDRHPRVLVTGVGGGIGQSVLKALHGTRAEVVAANADARAAGLYAAKQSYLIPSASSSSPEAFIEAVLELCTTAQIDLIIPGIEPELMLLAEAREQFARRGIQILVSEPHVIELCDDKLATAEFLQAQARPAPATQALPPDGAIDPSWFPVVVKPRWGGARSQGVHVLHDLADWDRVRSTVAPDNAVVQEYLDGDEYTCGSVTFDGRCYGVICMQRELRAGDTYRARVVIDEGLEGFVQQFVEELRPHGPCNVQLRVRRGTPYIFEVNPRCSGTTAARVLAGFNEPLAAVDWLLEGREPTLHRIPKVIFRYWSELALDPEEFERFQQTGQGNFDRQL